MRRRSGRSDRRSLETRLAALDARIFGPPGTPRFNQRPQSGGSRMVRILGSTGTRRRRRYQLAAILSATVLLGLLAVPAQGLTQSDFELDKNATNDLTTPHLGVLKSSINASVTAITVCEFTTGVYPPAP